MKNDRNISGTKKKEVMGKTCWCSEEIVVRRLLKHDIHIKPKSYKLELLGELVI